MTLDQAGDRVAAHRFPAGRAGAGERHALVHQRGERDPPAFALGPEPSRVGHARIGEEHLVELGVTGDLHERAHFDAGRVHVDDEVAEPAVLGLVGIGAGDEHPVLRDVAQRGPHLLTVHQPLVAVAHGARAEPGDVGARARFAEQLAPDVLVRRDAAGDSGASAPRFPSRSPWDRPSRCRGCSTVAARGTDRSPRRPGAPAAVTARDRRRTRRATWGSRTPPHRAGSASLRRRARPRNASRLSSSPASTASIQPAGRFSRSHSSVCARSCSDVDSAKLVAMVFDGTGGVRASLRFAPNVAVCAAGLALRDR